MEDIIKQILVYDKNIKSVMFNETKQELTMLSLSGSGVRYRPFTVEMFDRVSDSISPASVVLQEIHHNNIVGVRIING